MEHNKALSLTLNSRVKVTDSATNKVVEGTIESVCKDGTTGEVIVSVKYPTVTTSSFNEKEVN